MYLIYNQQQKQRNYPQGKHQGIPGTLQRIQLNQSYEVVHGCHKGVIHL